MSVNSHSTPSKPYSIKPGSDVPWLIRRACSGEWPYDPDWYQMLGHPAIHKRYARQTWMFVIPDLEDRSVKVGLEIVRRESHRKLENKEVKHFEVAIARYDGCRAEPHTLCNGDGCDGCRGLGVTFMVDKGKHVDLMGWVAITSVE